MKKLFKNAWLFSWVNYYTNPYWYAINLIVILVFVPMGK